MFEANRRHFIANSAALLSAAWASRLTAAPSKSITLGFIGTGSHGTRHNLRAFLREKDCRILAVCDVFKSRTERARLTVNNAYGNSDCQGYQDFRDLLARDDIDAVVISTPDHWHVPISLAALATGKHVFCEKPTLTIAEGRDLVNAVTTHKAIFQTGLEDRSVPQYHSLCNAVRNGAIGSLKHIDVELPVHTKVYIEEKQSPPADLDWNMWLGPAPLADYSPQRVDWMGWRMIRDYSGGILTDWGTHLVDSALVANFAEKSGPVSVSGTGGIPEGVMNTAMQTFDLNYTFANGVTMRVKSGGVKLRFEGGDGWCGNEGWRGAPKAHDPAILTARYESNRMWARPPGEHRDFLDAIASGRSPIYPAEDLHRLSSALHMGAIAMELGRKLTWDPASEAFVDDAEANALRRRPARDWSTA
jgi:myo-inositol 2-dehydrogenase/D-chiro-inositol 1-dehydrogenase